MEFTRVAESPVFPLEDADGRIYFEESDGYINFGDVARNLLDEQCQYASRYIDGRIPGYPVLGNGLRFNGLDDPHGNYHVIGIHPDDIEEFVRRREAHKALRMGGVYDNQGLWHFLHDVELEVLEQYLNSIGAFIAQSNTNS